jgi:hypothetical protein
MQMMQRTISTMPCSSSMPPASGMTNLNGYTGSGSALKVCSRIASDSWRSPAGPGQRHDAGQEEQHVQHRSSVAWVRGWKEAVEHVAAHMAVLGQRVGAGHHEQRAVQHDLRVQHPGVRLVQHIAENTSQLISSVSKTMEPGEELAEPGG